MITISTRNTKWMFLAASLIGLLWLVGTAHAQAGVLDQYQLAGDDQNRAIHANATYGQTFIVGATGTLSELEISVFSTGSNIPDLIVQILDVSGGLAAPSMLGQVSVPQSQLGASPIDLSLNSVTGTLVDLTSLNIQVQPGDQLAFVLRSAAVLPDLYASRSEVFTDQYPDGVILTGGAGPNLSPIVGGDGTFKIFVLETAAVGGTTSFLVDGSGSSAIGIAILTGGIAAAFTITVSVGLYARRRWPGKSF